MIGGVFSALGLDFQQEIEISPVYKLFRLMLLTVELFYGHSKLSNIFLGGISSLKGITMVGHMIGHGLRYFFGPWVHIWAIWEPFKVIFKKSKNGVMDPRAIMMIDFD